MADSGVRDTGARVLHARASLAGALLAEDESRCVAYHPGLARRPVFQQRLAVSRWRCGPDRRLALSRWLVARRDDGHRCHRAFLRRTRSSPPLVRRASLVSRSELDSRRGDPRDRGDACPHRRRRRPSGLRGTPRPLRPAAACALAVFLSGAGRGRGQESDAGLHRAAKPAPGPGRFPLDSRLVARARRVVLVRRARLRSRLVTRSRPSRRHRDRPVHDHSVGARRRGRVRGGGDRGALGLRDPADASPLVRARRARSQRSALCRRGPTRAQRQPRRPPTHERQRATQGAHRWRTRFRAGRCAGPSRRELRRDGRRRARRHRASRRAA